jgi:hypothetical protein
VRLNAENLLTHVLLPLLTQETAIMASSFAYGLRAGYPVPVLIAANCVAIVIDMTIFFGSTYLLSERLHDMLRRRLSEYYDRGHGYAERLGALRTSTILAFVLPSVIAMITVGLLRLQFWRAATGLLIGSAVYVVIPLLIAVPLAKALPPFLLTFLPWAPPIIGVVLVAIWLIRARPGTRGADEPGGTGSVA